MGRKRDNVLSEEKRNIIGQLIELYDIKTAADIQEALKDLLGGTIQSMLEAELDELNIPPRQCTKTGRIEHRFR